MRTPIGPVPLLTVLALAAGCSNPLTPIFERSISTENIYQHKILTMTGERRIAIIVPHWSQDLICAESLPDAVRAAGSRSALDLQLGGTGRPAVGVDDQFQTALVQTFTRTETADVVRQLGWQVCNAYANRAIDKPQYADLLTLIIRGANTAMEARAKAGTPVAAAGGTVQVNLGQPQPRRGAAGAGSGTQPAAPEKAKEGAANAGSGTNTSQGGTNAGTANPAPSTAKP